MTPGLSLVAALLVAATAAASTPSPPPAPAWPEAWTCYARHAGLNMPTPLDLLDRCLVRFSSLPDALVACRQRTPECSGVVEDNGLPWCREASGVEKKGGEARRFELRTSVSMEAAAGFASWLRVACSPPSPPARPPDVPRVAASDADRRVSWTAVAGGLAAAASSALVGAYAWRRASALASERASERAERAYREMQALVDEEGRPL